MQPKKSDRRIVSFRSGRDLMYSSRRSGLLQAVRDGDMEVVQKRRSAVTASVSNQRMMAEFRDGKQT